MHSLNAEIKQRMNYTNVATSQPANSSYFVSTAPTQTYLALSYTGPLPVFLCGRAAEQSSHFQIFFKKSNIS